MLETKKLSKLLILVLGIINISFFVLFTVDLSISKFIFQAFVVINAVGCYFFFATLNNNSYATGIKEISEFNQLYSRQLAHDFNNALNGIVGSAEILQHQIDETDQSKNKYLNMILESAERASELTRKIESVEPTVI